MCRNAGFGNHRSLQRGIWLFISTRSPDTTVTVSVTYDYACTQEARRVNYFFVIENTEALRGAGVSRQLLGNLKDAMIEFVNRVDYENGSQGGLTLFAQDYTNRVVLRGGREGRTALLQAIRSVSTEQIGNSAGAPSAIRDATERLPTGISDDALNMLIVVDAGAPVITKPLIDYQTACGAAHDAGVTLVVIGLENAGARGAGCASPGWFRRSRSTSGADLKEILSELAETLVSGKLVGSEDVSEWPNDPFSYVARSGSPRDPDFALAGEFIWTFEPPAPAGGRDLSYQLRAREGIGNTIVDLSLRSEINLFYDDGYRGTLPLDNPTICIHVPGDQAFCDDYFGQLTPTPPPTPVPPSPTPAPTDEPPPPATATPLPPERSAIYLPSLFRTG